MIDENVRDWLLEGDPSIRFQTKRDLLDLSPKETTPGRGDSRAAGTP